MGIIDILAFSKKQKCWVVIELKKDLLDKDAIIQGLSYLNYYKNVSNYKDKETNSSRREFKLLLIGQNIDSSIKKIIYHYQSFLDDWDIYYALFSIQLDKGINFNFQDEFQRKIENRIWGIKHGRDFSLSLHHPVISRCIPKLK